MTICENILEAINKKLTIVSKYFQLQKQQEDQEKRSIESLNKREKQEQETMADTKNVITFDGTKKNWKLWSIRFLAKENLSGYSDVMVDKVKVEPESVTPTDKQEIMIQRANATGYCELLLAMQDETCMETVVESVTANLPSG